ncbi:MAG: methylenetetrahydrofolate reductase [Desulfobacteraceae bacterium]|nr:methylenetetrahydrofolate reductase [Desulfobacteraceae bacterium]
MSFMLEKKKEFKITIEVVPPEGKIDTLMAELKKISHLPFDGFSVASNPIAKPKMSAMVFAYLLQQQTGKPAILHFTIRDHNIIGLQGEMWGAKALGLKTVLAMTGDPAKKIEDQKSVSTVGDVNVFELIKMSRDSGLSTGAVLDYKPEINGLDNEIKRLEKKVNSGAEFIVTQPIYDEETAQKIVKTINHFKVPVIMGILPLLSYRHAEFLHNKVAGIAVPAKLRDEIKKAKEPVKQGIAQAKKILDIAKDQFSGACIMPPFDRFEILSGIL